LCLVLFATVEPVVDGDTVTAGQKHNITKESHERSRCERENPDGNLLHNLEDNGMGKVYKQTHSIISFFAAKNRSAED
jgi:hypothetical protein